MATFGALAGKLLTLRRQVSFEATPRLCGLNLLELGRHLAPLEEFNLSTPGFFALAGSEQQQDSELILKTQLIQLRTKGMATSK